MGKKILNFIIQVIETAVIYIVILWLFNIIFDKDYSFGWSLLLQGVIFSLIFVPISRWSTRKKD